MAQSIIELITRTLNTRNIFSPILSKEEPNKQTNKQTNKQNRRVHIVESKPFDDEGIK